jgi:hypothetical protein
MTKQTEKNNHFLGFLFSLCLLCSRDIPPVMRHKMSAFLGGSDAFMPNIFLLGSSRYLACFYTFLLPTPL